MLTELWQHLNFFLTIYKGICIESVELTPRKPSEEARQQALLSIYLHNHQQHSRFFPFV